MHARQPHRVGTDGPEGKTRRSSVAKLIERRREPARSRDNAAKAAPPHSTPTHALCVANGLRFVLPSRLLDQFRHRAPRPAYTLARLHLQRRISPGSTPPPRHQVFASILIEAPRGLLGIRCEEDIFHDVLYNSPIQGVVGPCHILHERSAALPRPGARRQRTL